MTKPDNSPKAPTLMIALGAGLMILAFFLLVFPEQGSASVSLGAASGAMGQLMVAFVTGLTTGGLSCLAVQGGLLASSLAHQIETDMLHQPAPVPASRPKTRKRLRNQPAPRPKVQPALPIALFLLAKLAAYTLLGLLLGWLGSFLTFSPVTRAILLMLIGVFMIGNGLRMLNAHPVFRYFSIEPPKFITRYIRRTAKNGTELATPLFLGALTVFIPCGVTQAMMGVALATGSALMGAALMFAFTLGTSPVFFLVAYLTTQLGTRLESFFMRFVALVVLVLGLVSLNNGLNLLGSPFSFSAIARSAFPAGEPAQVAGQTDLRLDVANDGYFPSTLVAKSGEPVRLALVTNQTYSCSRDFVIPALGYYQLLPETGTVTVDIPPQPSGTRMRFTCSMGMYTGIIIFE
ncbi:MAG: sulfite exporter TauE/SafE family protein [Chloroflexota bacterium]